MLTRETDGECYDSLLYHEGIIIFRQSFGKRKYVGIQLNAEVILIYSVESLDQSTLPVLTPYRSQDPLFIKGAIIFISQEPQQTQSPPLQSHAYVPTPASSCSS